MITLSFLKLLEQAGFGTIDVDLFFQKLTLDKKGIYIADVGTNNLRGTRKSQGYELYARGNSDTDGYKRLHEISKYLEENYSNICELPPVPTVTTESYRNVVVQRPSTITNVGLDAQNRIIYSISGNIIY